MYRNMLISVSCDWETVKNVVTGNSSSKLDRTAETENLSNSQKCLKTLHIVGWVIKSTVGGYRTDEFRVNCLRVPNRRVQRKLLESTEQTSSESNVGGNRTDEFRVNCWRVPNRRVQ